MTEEEKKEFEEFQKWKAEKAKQQSVSPIPVSSNTIEANEPKEHSAEQETTSEGVRKNENQANTRQSKRNMHRHRPLMITNVSKGFRKWPTPSWPMQKEVQC